MTAPGRPRYGWDSPERLFLVAAMRRRGDPMLNILAYALGSPPPWPMDLMFRWAGPPDRYENEGWRERQRAYFNERLAGHEEKRRARG